MHKAEKENSGLYKNATERHITKSQIMMGLK
jgi:hypothetical protein